MHGDNLTIGGIQTYIQQLIEVVKQKELEPVVVQFANVNFKKKYNNVNVYGVDVKRKPKELEKSKHALKFIKKKYNKQDFIIFATEDLYVPTFTKRVLAIQHGISWDIPRKKSPFFIIDFLRKSFANYLRLIKIKKLKNIICVDYNYINWLRTQVRKVDKRLYVIPNSTNINTDYIEKENDNVNIIFARRFESYRGTRLFSNVIESILYKYKNVNVTFAGEGIDEKHLKNKFEGYKNVDFTTYNSEDSLRIHSNFHIAVIPTLGSEGTSLSLLEAMASKCAVIATNVGGMTNIVLDNFNGKLINPDENELYIALENLINDEKLRRKLANNAYKTACESFNNELWQARWKVVIDELIMN